MPCRGCPCDGTVATELEHQDNAMQRTFLSRLESLHTSLNTLRGADSALLKANHFDTHLNELAALIGEIQKLQDTQQILNDLGGALSVLLELLFCSDDHKFRGCLLHCLLQPFQDKLNQAMDGLERVV
ncbi:hypothetical protein SAMN05216186_10547 [Pseudomonas indica]|uniref:DUF1484 domain-containing protein n=2 Tax=Pseudomonas indica TaxID=137658 RepID=A0A1G8ZZ01_9PSED|nr:hypothetical protein SAMN05216186_10547 [Pseudomonas indica]